VRLYDRLFADAHPDAGGKNFMDALNPNALETITAFVEPGLANAAAEDRFQFERHGYFVADRVDSKPGQPIFNRIVTLKDSWGGK
jgi:glutaminyl-tRNA synthetase